MVIHARNFVTSDDALGGSVIERSLRFNSGDNPNLARTFGSSTNIRKRTVSLWVKRSKINDSLGQVFFHYFSGGSGGSMMFAGDGTGIGNNDEIHISNRNATSGSGDYYLVTNNFFRDPSAWYHLVLQYDTTQSTASDRIKLYINGSQASFSSASYPSQNYDSTAFLAGTATNHNIGYGYATGSANYFGGYLAEIHFLDGYAYDASYFGYTESQTGLWRPKRYEGTYGTNGFYLDFSDNSSTAALGIDKSPNGNDWTVSNFSVSAGAGNDSLEDTPTNNFCVLNSLAIKSGNVTLTNGSLDASFGTVSGGGGVVGTFAVSSGKWYWETTITAASGSARITIGVVDDAFATYSGSVYYEPGLTSASYGYVNSGTKYNNNTDTSYGASYTTNDVIGVALDLDKGTITFYKNNSSQGQAFSGLTGGFLPAIGDGSTNATHSTVSNFGQRAFAYTPPSGFRALSTKNLPPKVPSIRPQKHFDNVLWTGNGGTSQTVTGLEFQPDFVWLKDRSEAGWHRLQNSVVGANKLLYTNSLNSEATNEANGYVSSFTKDGFLLADTDDNGGGVNKSGNNYVAWCWKAGGASVTNNDGSKTVTLSANQEAGFSIIQWDGNTANATCGHGLGKKPKWFIVKSRTHSQNWFVYHASTGATKNPRLNDNATPYTNSNIWNDTEPTDTVINLGSSSGVNGTGNSYICYCWAEIPGYSKIGSYQANGSSDGPYVDCGFRPAWILIKNTSLGQPWVLMDNKINPHNLADTRLSPSSNAAEATSFDNHVDILSTGFKVRSPASSDINYSTTYRNHIFIAFAEQPGTTAFDTFPNAR